MTDHTDELASVRTVLQTARIEAHCNTWHLDKRALPALNAMADRTGEPQLHQAVEQTSKASEQLGVARENLRGALGLVEAYTAKPVREVEPG